MAALPDAEIGAALIHRNKPADNFVLIPNGTVRDRTLSYLARGILAEILSRPRGWRVTAEEMAAGSPVSGRRAVCAAFLELRHAGYLHRVVRRVAGGRFSTELHVFSEPSACGTGGCQDCSEPAESPAGDVSAGRTDIPVTDCRSAVGQIEDGTYEDVNQNLKDDRRSPAGEHADEIRWAFTDEQMPAVLKVIAGQAREHLKILINPGDQVSRYLLRTLMRGGQRYIRRIDEYAATAFAEDPDKWRTLAVAAADHAGHVQDGSYATVDYATDVLSSYGARARGEDYDAWTDQDFWDAHGQHEYLDLRNWLASEDSAA